MIWNHNGCKTILAAVLLLGCANKPTRFDASEDKEQRATSSNSKNDSASDFSKTEDSINACQDGRDNDNDGDIDCNDEECSIFIICSDSSDDSGDGDSGWVSDEDSDRSSIGNPDRDSDVDTDVDTDTDGDSDTHSSGDTDADTDTDVGGDTDGDTEDLKSNQDSAYQVINEPVIDGVLDDTVWRLKTYAGQVVSGNTQNEGRFDVVWNVENLYIAVEVKDESVCIGESVPSHQYDSVEIYIDPDNSKSTSYDDGDVQLIYKYLDNGYVEYGANTRNRPVTDMKGMLLPDGYTVEIAIPWEELGIRPWTHRVIGFDIGINDDDPECSTYGEESRDSQIRWMGTADNFENTAAFGELVFIDHVIDAPDSDAGSDSVDDTETDSLSDTETDTDEMKTYTALTINNPPIIDGVLSEDAWTMDSVINKAVAGESSNEGRFSAVWDEDNLYVALQVDDSSLCTGIITDSYKYDSIDIYLDPDNSKTETYDSLDSQIILKYIDKNYSEYGMNTQNKVAVDALGSQVDKGYIIEIAIPWSEIDVDPSPGVTIGFDIGINDDDIPCSNILIESRDAELRWNGTANNFENTSNFGELTLSEVEADPVDSETVAEADSETSTESESESVTETNTESETETLDSKSETTTKKVNVGDWLNLST